MQKLTQTLKALSDQNRLRIVIALMENDELCACQFTELLGIAGATVSRHLGVLHNAELIQFRKEGRWIFYRLNKDIEYPKSLLAWIHEQSETCTEVQQDLIQLQKILSSAPEDICRKQRSACCSD
ncbi:ArsR/SmtB family transcription factor [Halodesulfovibrio marinisediminis]|uniref:Transcriptional regulator, ArsR family n=1 Tax=Halodesulfovibrio marinisediminis DSM 17456 TaxID=1121457 RepID=A0A1N6FVN2_9BACT|nr:metalloregulator ArsR/SmtB family transcription factor [Halodesulfovibrio marinisediminis]SIN99334.1 transcriptional regulator, ArsR family [Halodesulfovibrio marinisediminis DSM 17456]